jgi:predicted NBD/HSP70 family sugar kinase
MKAIVAIDIGGTYIKYGLMEKESLSNVSKVATPANWAAMKHQIYEIVEKFGGKEKIRGVAISAPGAVDVKTGIIKGDSAIPYIHFFPFVAELEKLVQLPVTVQNDAKCAALAELWNGRAKDVDNALLFVLGSEIGGAVIVNRQLMFGKHLYSGEFGWMMLDSKTKINLSQVASPVAVTKSYNKKIHGKYTGTEMFENAKNGDEVAQSEINLMFEYLAMALFNLSVCFDPDKILIGGGISENREFIDQLAARTKLFLAEKGVKDIHPIIEPCYYHNSANLLGAVVQFREQCGSL